MNKLALSKERELMTHEPGQELLSFSVNQELFAVELKDILEIVVPPPITQVPRAHSTVLGVCSVRGQLVTVLDLRRIFGLPEPCKLTQPRILLAQYAGETFGLQVDVIHQVVRLRLSELEFTTYQGNSDTIEAVRGIGRPAKGEILVLLDLQALFLRSHH